MCAWFSVACKDGLLRFARFEEPRIKMKVRFARGGRWYFGRISACVINALILV